MTIDAKLWVRVIDISRNQGNIDFAKMFATGIRNLIIRVSNGQTIDDHFATYYSQALAAGFVSENICYYTFVNPKRGTGAQGATATLAAILKVVGHLRVGYMLDVENYAPESPNPDTAPVFGAAFAAHIREHIATVHALAPAAFTFGYSNLAYWNGPVGNGQVWVGDDTLAASIEWLPARYPAYSDAAYARTGYPPGPDGWPDWAYKAQPAGPLPPRGGRTFGWQFSAGFNHQGPTYGATSRDLDLNIVLPDAWARWTGKSAVTLPPPIETIPPPPITEDSDMLRLLAPTDSPARFYAVVDPTGRALRCEWTGDGADPAVAARLAFYEGVTPAGTPWELAMDVAGLINVSLDGPLPPGFKAEQFGNPGEIHQTTANGRVVSGTFTGTIG